MTPYEIHKNGCLISTDKAKLDIDAIHQFLSQRSYWALERTREIVVTSIEHSLCFGVYDPDGVQAGFARAVTDYTTFAWICDVFILEAYRGRGLSKWLVEAVVDCPQLKDVRQMLLATRDAQSQALRDGLYREYGGFVPLFGPEGWMERRAKIEI